MVLVENAEANQGNRDNFYSWTTEESGFWEQWPCWSVQDIIIQYHWWSIQPDVSICTGHFVPNILHFLLPLLL